MMKKECIKKKRTSKKFLVYFCFRIIYRSFFTYPSIKIKNKKNLEIFYIKSYERDDLNKHSEYYENINNTSVCILSKRKKRIDIINLLKIIFFLILKFKFWKSFLKANNLQLFSRDGFFIFLKFIETFSDAFKIIPFLKKHRKLVCFHGSTPIENLLCQYANTSNIETYSLQHALSIFNSNGTFESRFPICNYLNLVSKNILCWGDHNKNLYSKFSSARINIIGKPYIPKFSSNIEGVTFIFENKEFEEINNHLMNLSCAFEENNIQISRWFKPSHSLMRSGIVRDGPLRKIVVGCNSSLLVELGFLGFYVFVTKNSDLKKYLPNEIIISQKEFFIDKINNLTKYPKEIWKNFINCTESESLERYKKILN